nr:Chain C, Ns4a Peptide [Hepatitis C virus (isolate BK)]1NS3_D Chain D, Ns4a Peptide [Hepatitis C virus (isolate BK)]
KGSVVIVGRIILSK